MTPEEESGKIALEFDSLSTSTKCQAETVRLTKPDSRDNGRVAEDLTLSQERYVLCPWTKGISKGISKPLECSGLGFPGSSGPHRQSDLRWGSGPQQHVTWVGHMDGIGSHGISLTSRGAGLRSATWASKCLHGGPQQRLDTKAWELPWLAMSPHIDAGTAALS